MRRWRRAKAGEGQVVLLCGEAGVGKSRIAQTLRDLIGDDPYIRVRYQCSPYFTNSALHPIIRQLTQAAGFSAHDSPECKLERLKDTLALATDRAQEAAPLLAELLSIPISERHTSSTVSPDELKERTLFVLIEQMEGLAARRPLLLLFEDVHWIDPTSQELLNCIIDRMQSLPVLLIITFRPDYHPPWVGSPNVTLFTLSRMGSRDCAAIVEGVTGGKSFPDEVLQQIVAKSDGIPLFVEEIAKTVIETNMLREEPTRYVLAGPLLPLAIPSSLRDLLMARLDRIASAKEVAEAGAAIGREFSHELLAAVVDKSEPQFAKSARRVS